MTTQPPNTAGQAASPPPEDAKLPSAPMPKPMELTPDKSSANETPDSFGTPLKRPAARPPERPSLAQSLNNALGGDDSPKTQLVRGAQRMTRGDFKQDPVVGWLVVIGGPGLGAFRPIFEGNNTLGRSETQRIPVNFGDDAISSEEQVYIRYDSGDRRFLFVPNLAKTNVVSLNDEKPTAAVELEAMDVITVGRTQLVFVPFCGSEFDWSELTDLSA